MSSIWDYLPAYNTFFKLFAKVYIAVIIVTIIGYWIYTLYQKYLVDASVNRPATTEAPTENAKDPNKNLVYILWTGDMASTYLVISRILAGASVQPIYIDRRSSQTWVKLEKLCISNLRKLITKRIPAARTQLLPTIYLSDILDDTSFTETFRAKFAKLHNNKALQPYFTLVQWAYYYKIDRPILVSWLPLNGKTIQETDLLNKTQIELALTDKETGKPIAPKEILKMARESGVPYVDILHNTCTCWNPSRHNRCGECKGCSHIKMMQKKLMN